MQQQARAPVERRLGIGVLLPADGEELVQRQPDVFGAPSDAQLAPKQATHLPLAAPILDCEKYSAIPSCSHSGRVGHHLCRNR